MYAITSMNNLWPKKCTEHTQNLKELWTENEVGFRTEMIKMMETASKIEYELRLKYRYE